MAEKVVTGLVRFSYVNVFEPKAPEGSDTAKYSVSLIIDKNDKATLAKINAAINVAIEDGKAKLGDKIKGIKLPLRDGDEERDSEEYVGCMFLNANSLQKPGLVDRDLNPILDRDEFYSGCYGRASITFFAFNKNGKKGVACGLNNLQKIKDGPRLGASSTPEDDFKTSSDEDLDLDLA